MSVKKTERVSVCAAVLLLFSLFLLLLLLVFVGGCLSVLRRPAAPAAPPAPAVLYDGLSVIGCADAVVYHHGAPRETEPWNSRSVQRPIPVDFDVCVFSMVSGSVPWSGVPWSCLLVRGGRGGADELPFGSEGHSFWSDGLNGDMSAPSAPGRDILAL